MKGLQLPVAAAAHQEKLRKELLARHRPPLKTCTQLSSIPKCYSLTTGHGPSNQARPMEPAERLAIPRMP